jgi:nicotinamide riboside transporter PnuC|tara:strand:- start:3367 stop:3597 length:231 start_codon:yes stop_codon:yes gene_type:complete
MSKHLMIARWSGTFMGIAGALLVASNIEASKYGFPLFLVASALWGIVAYCIKDYALLLLQVVFFSIDSYGIYRWFM